MTDSITAGKAFLAHAGVLGMKWGQRKSEDEILADERKKAVRNNAGLAGFLSLLGANTLLDVATGKQAVVKKRGLEYVVDTLRRKPPAVVSNPAALSTGKMALKTFSGSKYGRAFISLGAFWAGAAFVSKQTGAAFDAKQAELKRQQQLVAQYNNLN